MKLIRATQGFVFCRMEHCRLIELIHEIKVCSSEGTFIMENQYFVKGSYECDVGIEGLEILKPS